MTIELSAPFKRDFKALKKKYKSLVADVDELIESLCGEPMQGVSIGKGCYKIRLAITAKNKGKSGGARVITYVRVVEDTVFLLSIYDKSEQEDIAGDDLSQRLATLDEVPQV